MFANAGGAKYELAKPKIQFADAAIDTAFPRRRIGKISGG